MSASSLEAYESGKRLPPVDEAQSLADALGTRVSVLLGIDERGSGMASRVREVTGNLVDAIDGLEQAVSHLMQIFRFFINGWS